MNDSFIQLLLIFVGSGGFLVGVYALWHQTPRKLGLEAQSIRLKIQSDVIASLQKQVSDLERKFRPEYHAVTGVKHQPKLERNPITGLKHVPRLSANIKAELDDDQSEQVVQEIVTKFWQPETYELGQWKQEDATEKSS